MTLLSPHRAFMDYPNSNQDLPLNQCENLEEVFDEITSELSQIEWSGIASNLRINPDKLHLVSLSSGCDLQRQKTLGLLCWVEDERSGATFERLVSALNQVDAKSLSGDVKAFSRLLRMRKASAQRKLEATQYYPLPISPHKNLPKSANGQWKFAELPHFILGSSSSAFFPSRSVPTNPTFDLTSSVSIHGARVNLLERNRWQIKTAKKNSRPATISGKTTQPRRRALGVHKRIGHVRIHTSIKTAVPLTNTPRDCHPEMMQEIIANKLFNYLLNETGSREILSMVSTLESINGLVVKRMTRGSINIETYIHKTTALKALWGHFESGQLNEMLQERLISENSLKMASAFDISLETSIDRAELESCLQQLQGSNRKSTAFNSSDRRATASYYRGSSPPRNKVSFSNYRVPYSGLQSSSKLRAASVPHSRSINVELAPSIRTV
uniref:Death domain-containing protein n=2 Tax=Ciona intestinalis TaxID=7719 RepID=H2XNM5_CIOIN